MKKPLFTLLIPIFINFAISWVCNAQWTTNGWTILDPGGLPPAQFTESGNCATSFINGNSTSGASRMHRDANINMTTTGFTYSFDLTFGTNTSVGDGFSFVITGASIGTSAAQDGGRLGYVGMTVDYIALEWDSFVNDATVGDEAGVPAQHMGIEGKDGGVVTELANEVTMGAEVRTGSAYRATVTWTPDGSGGGTLTQTINNGSLRTLTATISAATLSGYSFATGADFHFNATSNTVAYQTQTACLVSTPTPISLLYFTGEFNNASVELKWGTLIEINNNYFTLERSNEGVTWNIIATISATTSTQNGASYTYSDAFVENNGPVYYRLSQTDHDGTTTFFPIISVLKDQTYNISVIPNPCSDKTRITDVEHSTIEITTFMGTTLGKYDSTIGNEITLDVSNLQNGMYLLKIQKDNSIINKTLIVKK